jgi:hypothetical protein
MKNIKTLLALAVFATGASLANAQYLSDGPFGPVSSVASNTQRTAVEKQMASPAERAMANADAAAAAKAKQDNKTSAAKDNATRYDAFKQVDTAR